MDRFEEFLDARSQWADETFGTPSERGPLGPLRHLKEEVEEVLAAPDDLLEYVDCIFLLFDAARRAGFSYEELLQGCYRKLEINKARKWGPKTRDGAVKHVENS